jgi:hypothetical protein
MTAKDILSPVRFCKKCQADTEHYACGHCKVCAIRKGKDWAAKNPEAVKRNNQALYLKKKEQIKEAQVIRNALHPEKRKAANAAWRAANPEKAKSAKLAWRAANKDKSRIINQNRRAKTLANGGVLSRDIAERLFKLQKGKCACCGEHLGSNYHLDHIIPIALGGSNTDDNIQLLRQRCNNQKRALHPIDFMQSRGFLL